MSDASTITLGEIMASKSSSVDPSKHPEEIFDLYSVPAFDSGKPAIAEGASIGSAKQVVHAGDVLLSRIVPHIRRAWVVAPSRGRRMIASGEWLVFRGSGIRPGYLRHVLIADQFHKAFMRTVAGVGGSLLRARRTQVAQIVIPLPDLGEQKRIAAILDAAEALREKRRQAVETVKDLEWAVFQEMFGDPITNTYAWPLSTIEAVSDAINDCPHSTPTWSDEGVVCLRTSNLTQGGWNWADTRSVSEEDFVTRSRRGLLQAGDIVLSREGTVGVAAIVPSDVRMCMGQRLVQLKPASARIDATFLLRYLLYALAPEHISRFMVGSTSQHLNVKELRSLPVRVPPLELQQLYAQRVNEIAKHTGRVNRSAEQIGELSNALCQRAFRGEL